jgi:hypothetical protein
MTKRRFNRLLLSQEGLTNRGERLKRLQAETAAELDASLYRQPSYLPWRVIPHSQESALD